MAFGVHWEWRGFGVVSGTFIDHYCQLESTFESQRVEDLYLWIPNLIVNAKFRKGAEGGLKFKRLKNSDNDIEQWYENRDELFDFPLAPKGWNTLHEVLSTVNVGLPPYPSEAPSRAKTIEILEKTKCRTVKVEKLREGRLWQGPNGKVKVEWACITAPQKIISIGLETWDEDPKKDNISDEQAKEDIKSAIDALGLENEPLEVMNYMDAVSFWARCWRF